MSETQEFSIAWADARKGLAAGSVALMVFGTAVLLSGAAAFFVTDRATAVILFVLTSLAVPATPQVERWMGLPGMAGGNPLRKLVMQMAMLKLLILPAALLVFLLRPALVTVALAAIVGGYYLPYSWIYRTRVFIFLGVAVAAIPWAFLLLAGAQSYPYALLAWGSCDWIAAYSIRRELRTDASR